MENLEGEGGLARFLRQLTGLNRVAAKAAFSEFVSTHRLSADQNEFIDMLVGFLTDSGTVDPRLFYEAPFTDIDALGIEGIFTHGQVDEIFEIVSRINQVEAA